MKKANAGFSIGKVAERTGIAVSAIRFYEEKGLLNSGRNAGGQRVFTASDIRRVSFIIIAQKLGFSLAEIKAELSKLPDERTPTKRDWDRIGRTFSQNIDARIEGLTTLKDKLSDCIGCGCLSLQVCALYNKDDAAGAKGAGPRYLMGDKPEV